MSKSNFTHATVLVAALTMLGCSSSNPGSQSVTQQKTGTPDDIITRMAREALISGEDQGGLCPSAFKGWTVLLQDDFSNYSGTREWPLNAGYHGDWSGDWFTENGSARVYNPNWPNGAEVPAPKFTGFVKFLKIWPAAGSTLTVEAVIDPIFTSPVSTANVLIYYFDSADSLISVDPGSKIFAGPKRTLSLSSSQIPAGTARVAIVPIVFIAQTEQGTADFDSLKVTYEPPSSMVTTAILTDNFSVYDAASQYGSNQPRGWAEYGSDWYVLASNNWATVWNPTWPGGAPGLLPSDTGLIKTITLAKPTVAGDTVSARGLIAASFTDPSSYGDINITFGSQIGPSVHSPPITGSNWGYQTIERQPVPAGTTTLYVAMRAFLGPVETSSLYVDDVSVSIVSGPAASPTVYPDGDGDQTVDLCDNCPTVFNFNQASSSPSGIGDACAPHVVIALTPANPALAQGQSVALKATGTYDDGTKQDLTQLCVWSSSSASVASVSNTSGAKGAVSATAPGSSTITATYGLYAGSTGVTVSPPVLVAIDLLPVSPSVAKGTTFAFTATGLYSDNSSADVTSQATWSSLSPQVASISNNPGTKGAANALTGGTTTITATIGSVSASTNLTVTAATLVSVDVQPSLGTLAKGTTLQLTAMAIYSDNSTLDVTSQVNWSSSAPSVASVTSAGLATGVNVGTAVISGALGTVSDTSTLTVTSATLSSIAVDPAGTSAAAGTSVQYTATGIYSDNSTQNLTSQVTWSSSSSAATISNAASSKGLATAAVVGSANIAAALGSISGTTALTVTSATLVSIDVQPAAASIAKGTTLQFVASGLYSDGTVQDLSSQVVWSSSPLSIATVSNTAGSKGLARAAGVGAASISASYGTLVASSSLAVTAATLSSISVEPNLASAAKGTTLQFTATGTYSDGTFQDLTTQATWTSASTAIATASNATGTKGLSTAIAVGSTTITAAVGTKTGSNTLTVTSAVLASLSVSPADASAAKGTKVQYSAIGIYSDASKQDLTNQVTWAASSTVASVSNAAGSKGLGSALIAGTTSISATLGTISAAVTLTVTSAVLVSLDIQPGIFSLSKGTSTPTKLIGLYTDASTQDLTSVAAWSSSSTAIATVSNATGSKGTVSGAGVGAAVITAAVGSITDTADVTVTNAALVSIALSPLNASAPAGQAQQLSATGTYTDGTTQDITAQVTWSSSNTSVAVMSNVSGSNGRLTSLAQGGTTIRAALNTISATTAFTVTAAVLTSLTVTAPALSVPKGYKTQFTATGNFSDGSTKALTTAVTWISSVTTVAAISNTAGSNGLVTVVGVGTTNITASYGGKVGSATLTGNSATLSSIAVTPGGTTRLAVGQKLQLLATGTFSNGQLLDLTTQVSWSSSKSRVASISLGLVTAKRASNTAVTLKASSKGARSGTTQVLVQ